MLFKIPWIDKLIQKHANFFYFLTIKSNTVFKNVELPCEFTVKEEFF